MADTAVTERRIRPIQDAIAAGNWKQALKECEKWHKKGESSDRFLALKGAVLMHQPDNKQREKGQLEILQLCRRPQPVLNLDAIYQLQDSLKQLSLDAEEGPKLWERAIAARPTDKDLLTTWLDSSITASNWQSAQKATTAIRKAFPKERQYEFWNIIMCYLIHEDQTLPEKQRTLFGTLANRMIMKAAQPTPSDKGITTPEELSLFAEILIKTGGTDDLIRLLQSDQLSAVANLDRSHTNTLLMRALGTTEDSTGVARTFIRDVISGQADDDVSQDDRFWSLFIRSADKTDAQKEAVQKIDEVLDRSPNLRQALLAKLDLLAGIAKHEPASTDSLLQACLGYCNLFMTKAFCFDDIINRLQLVGSDSVRDFQTLLKKSVPEEPHQRLFLLKLDYSLLYEQAEGDVNVLDFAQRAIQLYSETRDQQIPYPEAALLAALGLLREAAKSQNAGLVLQASMILRTASVRFKDYYPLRVLLMQVQLISGQVHLAMDGFLQLSIKNMQWETVGHLLLTRIATLHPYQHGHGEDSLNALGALDLCLSLAERSQQTLDKAIREGLRNESYSNVTDTVRLRHDLQRSYMRQLYTLEERKCRRVLGITVKPGLEKFVADTIDLRDESFMPTYGTKDEMLKKLLSCGPRPQQGWINMSRLQEYLLAFMVAELGSSDTGLIAYTLSNLEEARASVSNEIPTDLTVSEREIGLCTMILSGAVLGQSPQVNQMEDSTDRILVCVQNAAGSQRLKAVNVNGVRYPDWQYIHHQFVRLETLRIVAYWVAVMNKKLKAEKDKNKQALTANLKNKLAELRTTIGEQVKMVHDQTREVKEGLGAPGVLGKLVDAVLGRVDHVSETQQAFGERVQELQDEAAVEEYCGSMRESWEDALDGILATEVRVI